MGWNPTTSFLVLMHDKNPATEYLRYHRYADYLVRKKYLEAEVRNFEKKVGELGSWAKFKLREETRSSVMNHLWMQMASYTVGDVNKKSW